MLKSFDYLKNKKRIIFPSVPDAVVALLTIKKHVFYVYMFTNKLYRGTVLIDLFLLRLCLN